MKAKFYTAFFLIPILIGMAGLKTCADSWVQKANFGGGAREDAIGFAIGTKGYVGMGIGGGPIKIDFWEYSQGDNTWIQKANFAGTARDFAIGFAIGTKGYIGIGYAYNDLWEYDTIGNTWTPKAVFGSLGRYYAAGFAIGTKGYIGTGDTYDTAAHIMKDLWEYDQNSNTWTQKADFGGKERTKATGFAIGTKGYIGTGLDSSSTVRNDFWEYDPVNNTWTQKANFGGLARGWAIGFAIGTRGYIGTGFDHFSNVLNDFWEYDQGSNTWTQKMNFGGVARSEATGFAIGTKGYVGLGRGVFDMNDFWEYTPDSVNGIEELTIVNAFSIYPNPLTSSSVLQLSTQLKDAEVVIYDVVGKEMIRKKLTGDKMEIEKRSLVSGVYFVRVSSGGKQWVEKMVVE